MNFSANLQLALFMFKWLIKVTGANKGVGFGIVELLARHLTPTSEWHVYLTARNEQRGLQAVKQLSDKGLYVKFHQLDVTNAESRHKLLDYIKKKYPNGISILVNNAGIINEVWKRIWLSSKEYLH